MSTRFPHEQLHAYRSYLEVAGLCADIVCDARKPLVVLEHLDRAIESVGVNLMRANAQPVGSSLRSSCLDVSIASAHECAASLDVCLAREAIKADAHVAGLRQLWGLRGLLLGLKSFSESRLKESREQYGTQMFPFARLDMYRVSIEAVRWVNQLLIEANPKARASRRLDVSTTGTVLNIAEGYGRATVADQNKFMQIAQDHAFQTVLLLDLLVARSTVSEHAVEEGKAKQARVISMLHAWCTRGEEAGEA